LVGGALLDQVGTAGLFRGAAAVMLLALAVFAATRRAIGDGEPGRIGASGSPAPASRREAT